jgi:hypothetical protein
LAIHPGYSPVTVVFSAIIAENTTVTDWYVSSGAGFGWEVTAQTAAFSHRHL